MNRPTMNRLCEKSILRWIDSAINRFCDESIHDESTHDESTLRWIDPRWIDPRWIDSAINWLFDGSTQDESILQWIYSRLIDLRWIDPAMSRLCDSLTLRWIDPRWIDPRWIDSAINWLCDGSTQDESILQWIYSRLIDLRWIDPAMNRLTMSRPCNESTLEVCISNSRDENSRELWFFKFSRIPGKSRISRIFLALIFCTEFLGKIVFLTIGSCIQEEIYIVKIFLKEIFAIYALSFKTNDPKLLFSLCADVLHIIFWI
jgi:hypothetical protein